MFDQHCRLNSCCSCSSPSSTRRSTSEINHIPMKRTIYVLDNELRLRSMTNDNSSNSSKSITHQNTIGRFDELTHFFNVINGLFYQSALTLGLSTYRLAPLFRLSDLNIGLTLSLDQQNLEQQNVDFLQNMTIYSIIGRHVENPTINHDRRQNKSMGIVKFQTSDQNLMFGINHRWSSSLSTMFRFGTASSKRLWSRVEYRRPTETYELISEYNKEHSSSVQFSCLSCLWKRQNYQIDGGFDLRITQREKLADLGFRLRHSSNTMIFKCDLYHPFEHYLIAFQRSMTKNFLIGLLAEKLQILPQDQPIKFSLMSQWTHHEKSNLRIHSLLNTHHQLGFSLIYQSPSLPLIFQIFSLYSWKRHRCKWGVGIEVLL